MANYSPVNGYSMDDIMPYPESSMSAYISGCIDETAISDYGRRARIPIHDALHFATYGVLNLHIWCEALGLVVENGKLCAVYEG